MLKHWMAAAFALACNLACATLAHGATPAVPTGRLPDTVKPNAYRLELTVDPTQTAFSGHTEIDATLAQAARTIFLHGSGLRVSKARVAAGEQVVTAKYKEVDDSGVVQLDLPNELPAGKITLTFDYTADFRTGAEGLFRAEVGGMWYAWTQFEPIDARRMFPGFDEPGFKTPFTITVTAPKDMKAFSNSPEANSPVASSPEAHSAEGRAPGTNSAPSAAMIVHHFTTTRPLPTYLVAIGVGPFDVVEGNAPANAVRKQALPFRVIATKGQAPRMQLAATEGPQLLALIESDLRIPYPFEKLDLLATPLLGGAMENAGLIIFDDTILLLDANAPMRQVRSFAEVTAHEMAHQWFGDLVTPTWWTDIWLNESFAEWMGKKVGDQWRPELGIAASELGDALDAMNADSLSAGRPIHQTITQNRQIASAFDSITYLKGAQVLTMFESYLGTEKFSAGVRRHLERYRYANASAEDFFESLGAAAQNPKIVSALRTFTDQRGVPLITVTESAQGGGTLSQSRYRPLGVKAEGAQTWEVPICLSRGSAHSCTLLSSATGALPSVAGSAPLMPNAGGAGYYRFRLDAAGWDRLIPTAANLPAREALALGDSVWADFAAGSGSFERVIAAAKALSTNPERLAAIYIGYNLKDVADTALTEKERPAYHELMRSIYGPRLAAMGFDPRPGAHASEPVARQALRQSLVPLVALEGRDPKVRAQLAAAAVASLKDPDAIDPAFRDTALIVAIQDKGETFLDPLRDAMLRSSDPLFRSHASRAIGSANTAQLASRALAAAFVKGIQSIETMRIVLTLGHQPGARDAVVKFADQNFKRLMDAFPGFAKPELVQLYDGYCSEEDATRLGSWAKAHLKELGGGDLELAQTTERIRLCAALRKAKGAEISAALGK